MRRVKPYLPLGAASVLVVVGLVVAANRLTQPSDAADTRPSVPAIEISSDGQLPEASGLEKLAREDPAAFLENCIRRYRREVKGYTCILQKQERVDGKLQPTEVMDARYREKPRSIYMEWLENPGRAERVLYVEGENDGKLLARPRSSLARKFAGDVVERDINGDDGRKLLRFGLAQGSERTLAHWVAARKEEGKLPVKYAGEARLKEANDRLCYKFVFTPRKPRDNGVTELTAYIDKETWLQIGTVLKGEDGKLIGEYIFRDIRLNPEFKPEQFQRSALIP